MNVVPLPIVLSIATLAAFTAYASDSTMAQASGSFDWFGLVKDAGAVGICVWMLVWFQRRSDVQHSELAHITDRAITAVEHNADANRDLAQAVRELRESVYQCPRK
jgi:hypothetical protein